MTHPPGTGSMAEQFADLKRQFAELTRKSPVLPSCTVRLSADVAMASNTTHYAGASWAAYEDDYAMFTPANPCFITVAPAGYYLVHYHSTCDGFSTPSVPATASAKIHLNVASTANSIAPDVRSFPASGTDGAICDPIRTRIYLNEGDKLYWSNWTSITSNINALAYGSVPTEMTVQFVSSQ